MERKANYAAVGAFVIAVIAAAAVFVYWYAEGRDSQNYVRYEIYFPGSITGLSVGSSVRYLGVEMGKVRRIRLDPRSPERVQVTADIDDAAPIAENTAANLSTLSFATGLLYIDLRQVSDRADVLAAVPSEKYPVIPSMRSGLDAFISKLPELAGSVAEVLESVQEIFSKENSKTISDLVNNLHQMSEDLPATLRRVDILLADMTETSLEARRLAVGLNETAEAVGHNVGDVADRLTKTAAYLEKATEGIQLFVEENRAGVASFTQTGLPQLQRTLEETRGAVEEVRALARNLKENPSQLIFQPGPKGVEVPR